MTAAVRVRDAAGYIQQPRADLLPLQGGAEDLAGLVEGEQGVQAALQALCGAAALGYIVDDDAECLAAAVGDHARADLDVDQRPVLPAVAPLADEVDPSSRICLT